MRVYLMTTGVIFALLALVHVWRFVAEGAHVATDPWFVGITVLAALLCGWAFRLSRAT